MSQQPQKPAEVFPPGEHIREELDARGWTQAEFAWGIGLSRVEAVNLLAGRMEVTPVLASRLAELFGTSPVLWLNLQAAYDLAKKGD